MDDWFACTIDTRIVYGFLDAGKTTYIRDCIRNDYFYKYGTTLILCFEQGEEEYDEAALREKNTRVAYYEGGGDVETFCMDQIGKYRPDRIYVEMNAMLPELRSRLPGIMKVTSAVTWIDWATMKIYLVNFRQMISQMVTESVQVTFRGCPSKELLAPYSQEFRLMNHRASYLRQDPMGYHERAFDRFVPYSLEEGRITISAGEYLVFWLDAVDHPDHYDGKRICFTDPLELRHVGDSIAWSAGRVVMTCCMSDLQFMSFELTDTGAASLQGGWVTLEACGKAARDQYGRKVLKLVPEHAEQTSPPEGSVILQAMAGG